MLPLRQDDVRGDDLVSVRPNLVLHLQGETPQLIVSAENDDDDYLLIRGSDGGWLFNDNERGQNPMVTISAPAPGDYTILDRHPWNQAMRRSGQAHDQRDGRLTRRALGKLRPLHIALRALWSVAALLGLTSPALAQDCRLALVLALDVSASVDKAEYSLQREGLARALMDRAVVRAFLAGDPVALYIFEWASPSMQEPLGDNWVLVESEDDLVRIADALLGLPRTGSSDGQLTTGLGAALIHAAEAFEEAPDCRAHTVDVSGDGRNNSGIAPRSVYASYPFDDVTVNALVVNAEPDGGHPGADEQLIVWFRANVLLGQDAFWLSADGYDDFERAMRMKLLRELQAADVSGWPTSDGAG